MAASALDVYVKNVLTYTASGSSAELVEVNRKAVVDVLEKNVTHLNRVIETLNVDEHSLSIVTILLAKFNHSWNYNNNERILETLSQIEMYLPLLNQSQIQMGADLFVALLRKVSQYCLRNNEQATGRDNIIIRQALIRRGIRMVAAALSVFVSEPGVLTSLHACLFCLCLKAGIYEPAIPYLETPITKIFKEAPSANLPYIDSKWVLLYFYYGGLIYGSLGRLRECLLMFENVLCIPAVSVSAIVITAYKKYVLISMILHNKIIHLPNYRPSVIPRSVKHLCTEYTALESICNAKENGPDYANAVLKHLQQHRELFETDGNVGLMKRLVRKIRENSVMRIAKCFSTITFDDFVRRCYFNNAEHAIRYLLDMSAERKINVRIDQQNQIIYLDEIKVNVEEEELEKAIKRVLELDKLIAEFDERLRTNPMFISRSSKLANIQATLAHDDEGFQQGASYSSPPYTTTKPTPSAQYCETT